MFGKTCSSTKVKKEPEIQKRAEEWLFKHKLKEKGLVFSKKTLDSKEAKGHYQPDLIGVDSKGSLYIVECKSGEINRPSKGLGQLLLYARLIRRKGNFEHFREQINKKSPIKTCGKKLGARRVEKLKSKIKFDNRMFIVLAVSKEPKSRWDFLKELVTHVKPTRLKRAKMYLEGF